MISISNNIKEIYPNLKIGILVMNNVKNIRNNEELHIIKRSIEESLINKFQDMPRKEIINEPVFKIYKDYYKKFKKTYHVLLQLESIANKGRHIPNDLSVVEAMFMGELKNYLLTAAHDMEKVNLPISLNVSNGEESFLQISQSTKALQKNDIYISDSTGVLSSIIYGPDHRTKVSENTKRVVYMVYGLAGITKEEIINHLEDIKSYNLIVSSEAKVEVLEVF